MIGEVREHRSTRWNLDFQTLARDQSGVIVKRPDSGRLRNASIHMQTIESFITECAYHSK